MKDDLDLIHTISSATRKWPFVAGDDVVYTLLAMIIPLGDDNRDRRTVPIVTYVFIAINVLVFVFLQRMGNGYDFTYSYSAVPEELLTGQDIVTKPSSVIGADGRQYVVPGLGATPLSVYITLFTSMFMHGGWAHLLGNMLYLWIFGDNVEDRLGKIRYILFYLLCGILAVAAHVASVRIFGGDLRVPMLGASGAISGVLGAYLVLFPKKRVRVILIRILTSVPAWVAVGLWFVFQLINGIGILGAGSSGGGVAYAAHIGGFVAGMALVWLFLPRTRERPDSDRRA